MTSIFGTFPVGCVPKTCAASRKSDKDGFVCKRATTRKATDWRAKVDEDRRVPLVFVELQALRKDEIRVKMDSNDSNSV